MKQCSKCGRVKNLDEYHRYARSPDGRHAHCMECKRDYDRRYREANAEKKRASDKAYRQAHYAQRKAEGKRHRVNNPEKTAARKAVFGEIRYGRMVPQPCEVCGSEPAEAHHCDYGKPLEVMWLCKPHHIEWHKHNKAIISTRYDPKEKAA